MEMAEAMASAAALPSHLRRMTWYLADPSEIIGLRDEADLLFREIFAGNLPVLGIERCGALPAGVRIAVDAEAVVAPAPGDEVVYRGMLRSELALAYSPRAVIPDMIDIFSRWGEEGRDYRDRSRMAGKGLFDIRYGPGRRQTLDLYRDRKGKLPLQVVIHGGYFQSMDKVNHAQFAEALVDAGMAVAVVNYDLCPGVALDCIVREIAELCVFLWREADQLGIDRRRIQLIGHSAGAVLAALVQCQPWCADIPPGAFGRALLISGLYDLEPLLHLPVNRVLDLDEARARALSAHYLAPRTDTDILLAVGAEEPAEFQRHSEELLLHWRASGAMVDAIHPPGHHLSVLEGLRDPQGDLFQAAVGRVLI